MHHDQFSDRYPFNDIVECQSVEEAIEAAAAGADIVMLDNFTHETIGEAAAKVKQAHPHVLLEASGVRNI